MPPRYARIVAVAAAAIGAGTLAASAGWLPSGQTPVFYGVILAAVAVSAFATRHFGDEGVGMPPSFVIDFTSLLFFGANPTTIVAVAGAAMRGVADPDRPQAAGRIVLNAAITAVAIQAAGLSHGALGGTIAHFVWPWQAGSIAAAVLAYCLVTTAAVAVLVPLCTRQPVRKPRREYVLRDVPIHLIGAALAAGLAELIDHQLWEVLAVAAVPLYFAYHGYRDYVNRLEDEQRRGEVIDSLDQGMAVVDGNGRITLWDAALERIVGCPAEQALGRSVGAAVPALATTELPRALAEALAKRTATTLRHVGLASPDGGRVLQIRIVPVAGGVTLLWQDVSERARAEHALKRSEERFALTAEGANDGLWEWDLRTQEFYFSSRWAAMVGLPARACLGRPEDWFTRVHPDDLEPLKDSLQAHVAGRTDHVQHEHRIRHVDGSFRRVLCRGVAVRSAGGRSTRIAGSLTDTTDRAAIQERLRTAGFCDPLTGLRNRADFVEELGRRLDEFKRRRSGDRFAVIYLDLDRFKIVNDSLGHLVGDELLISVSRRLESCVRPGDALARLGGDEFAILLNTVTDERQANAIAFRIQDALSAPFLVSGREVFSSASIGIALGLPHYASPDEIMRDADTAMYHAKSHGKARHELFDADMHARTRDRLGLENDLRHAVNGNDFEVHYQPIVSLKSGMCVGFESLVRWTRNGEAISPATFVPIAEELGLIDRLGTWVLQEACRTFAEWKRRFPQSGLDCITVNASSRQLLQQNFPSIVEQAVRDAKLKPSDLRLEITETALMDSPNMAAAMLRELRDFGVKIYLDDFGTGYSSLSHLHKLPVDALKIDRSFVRSLLSPERPMIVESILALARTLNTSVVAEGIESDVQARELERLGCTHAQGFLFSRPLTSQAAEALLTANQPLGPKRGGPEAREPELSYAPSRFEWPDTPAVTIT